MSLAARDNTWSIIGSLFLHGLLVLAVIFSARFSFQQAARDLPGPSIEAVAVDSRVLQTLQDRKQAQADAEQQRRAAEQAQREQAAEAARSKAAEQQHAAEQARVAEVAQAAEQAAAAKAAQVDAANAATRLSAAKAAAAKMAAAKTSAAQAAAQAQQRAEQQAAKAAADAQAAKRKQADDKVRSERESELRRQLADEEHVSAVENSPLRDRYIASIQGRITRAWLKPESAHAGIVCHIEVTQIPGGEVTRVSVTDCNGDEAVRQSIENAVYRASPLPEPPDPALFQRNLTLVFKPNG